MARVPSVICDSDGYMAHGLEQTWHAETDAATTRSAEALDEFSHSQSISTCRGGGQKDNFSAGRPGCGSPLARASCERTPTIGVRGGSQGGSHPHCQLHHSE
eukprot:3237198-Pleurochrysis_carterae.AAC.2